MGPRLPLCTMTVLSWTSLRLFSRASAPDVLTPARGRSHLGRVKFGSKGSWSQDAERRIQVSRPPQECFIWKGISSALEQPRGLQDPEGEHGLQAWHTIMRSKAWWVLSATVLWILASLQLPQESLRSHRQLGGGVDKLKGSILF